MSTNRSPDTGYGDDRYRRQEDDRGSERRQHRPSGQFFSQNLIAILFHTHTIFKIFTMANKHIYIYTHILYQVYFTRCELSNS